MGDGGVGRVGRGRGGEVVDALVGLAYGSWMWLLGVGISRCWTGIDPSSLPVRALPCFPDAMDPAPDEYPDAQTDQGCEGGAHADDEARGYGLVQGQRVAEDDGAGDDEGGEEEEGEDGGESCVEEGGEGAAVVGGFGRTAGVWGSAKLLPRSRGHRDGGGCGESIFVDGGSAVRIQWLFIAVRWGVGLDVFGRERGGLFLYVQVGGLDVGDSKEKGVFVCLRPCRSALPVEEMGLRYLEVIASGVVE